jgi:hypothetical protein
VDIPPFTGRVVAAIVAVGAVIGVLANLEQISGYLNAVYAPVWTCAVTPAGGGQCAVVLNVFFLLAVSVIFATLLAVAGFVAWEIAFRPDRRIHRQVKRLKGNKDRLVARINSVVNKLYGDADVRRFNFTDITESYEVSARCDLRGSHRYVMKGGSDPTHFWRQVVFSDGSSPALESFEALGYSAKVLDAGKSVEYVELEDSDRAKAVAVFFLPEIKAGETRTLEVEYSWPGFMNDLITKDRSDFEIAYKSENLAATSKLELAFKFARALGEIEIQDITPKPAAAAWDCQRSDNWTIWTLRSATYPLGGKSYKFEIARKVSP